MSIKTVNDIAQNNIFMYTDAPGSIPAVGNLALEYNINLSTLPDRFVIVGGIIGANLGLNACTSAVLYKGTTTYSIDDPVLAVVTQFAPESNLFSIGSFTGVYAVCSNTDSHTLRCYYPVAPSVGTQATSHITLFYRDLTQP